MPSQYAPHLERLLAVAGAPSGRRFAVAGERDAEDVTASQVHVFNAGKRSHTAAVDVPAAVGALAFLADDLLVVGGHDGKLVCIDAESAEPAVVGDAEGPGGSITALATDAIGKTLVVTTDSGRVGAYRLEVEGAKPKLVSLGARGVSPRPLRCATLDVNQPRLVCGGDDGIARVLPLEGLAGAQPHEIPSGEGGIGALVVLDDGRVIVGCGDGSIRISYLDGAADEENRSGDAGHEKAVSALVLGPQLRDEAKREIPRRLFSAGHDGVLKSWPLDSKRKPKTVELSSGKLVDVAWVSGSSRAKADKRGGLLVSVDDERIVAVVTLDEQSTPAEEIDKVRGRLAELSSMLRATSAKVREQAVVALGEIPEDEARLMLERELANNDISTVRRGAAEALGLSLRRRSRGALASALGDKERAVRGAAYDALKLIDEGNPLSPARAAVASRHPDIRKLGLEALPALRDASPIVPGLIAGLLTDADASVRQAAFVALRKIEPAGSVEAARTAFTRGPDDIRTAAVLHVGRSRAATRPEGYEIVEDALDDDAGEVRRVAFLVSIAARPKLGRRLYAIDPRVREAIDTLHRDGQLLPGGASNESLDDDDLAPLFAALICRHPDTALRGARAMALLEDPRATGALLQLSREPSAALRKDVVNALLAASVAMPGDDRLRTRLQWLLDDGDAGVRSDALDALLALAEPLGDTGLLQTAATALESGQPDIRERAMAIVVKFGPGASPANAERADELLGAALDDEASKVRNTAFKTLWAWHGDAPEKVLPRASAARHADIRLEVVREIDRLSGDWADALLLAMVVDPTADVGLAAYNGLTRSKKNKDRAKAWKGKSEVHLAALGSPRPKVRAAGCRGAKNGEADALRVRLIELLEDESAEVHEAAIEALDHLVPKDQQAFVTAYGSKFWGLRVRAAELHGKRRDRRAMSPMQALLALPEGDINRPSPVLRQRAAAAMADVGDDSSMSAYVSLLSDDDPLVREMGARGLAAAVKPGLERPLVAALSHDDLPVRSWVAEGLARIGDPRAVPVLAGTLAHDHKPIRLGAILSFVALGPDGVRGIMQGLEDPDREIQDLVFAIVVARDLALARKELPADLLMAALAASSPELRYVAARALEVRTDADALNPLVEELVGPRKPDRAAELDKWPSESDRRARLNVLISVIASDDPAQRYAAARVLSLRPQPEAFWREAERLGGPVSRPDEDAPTTGPEFEKPQPRKRGWIRRLITQAVGGTSSSMTERVLEIIKFAGGTEPRKVPPAAKASSGDISRLVFGTYVGLVRQAPAPKEADETHRVRRDSLGRLGELAADPQVGRAAVLPVLRRALSDPHHLVRKAAVATLRQLYGTGDTTPASLALAAQFADVGRSAVDELVALAQDGHEQARALVLGAVNAPSREVRSYAVAMIQRLFESGSLEPWLVALESRYADVRLSVVDRLVDAQDERVDGALGRALESDHEDLRLKAALALAQRGDVRSVDVLAAFLRSDDAGTVRRAMNALVGLVRARDNADAAARVSAALANRLEDDPEKTADSGALVDAIGRVGHPDGAAPLLRLVEGEDKEAAARAFRALVAIGTHRTEGPRKLADGRTRQRYDDARVLPYIEVAAAQQDPELRKRAVSVLRDVDDVAAEALLGKLLDDRDPEVRVAAAEALAFRADVVEGASLDALALALRQGRRELVLPAAAGMASRRRPEALQALLLVLKAGEQPERERALVALGRLGNGRALPDMEVLVDPDAELTDEDRALAPAAAEGLGRMLATLEAGDERDRVRLRVETLVAEARPDVRKRAMTGLRWAGDDRSRGLLERILADAFEGADLRSHAAELLGALANPASEAALADAVSDADRTLRYAAAKSLESLFPDDPTRVHMIRLRCPFGDIAEPSASFLALHGEPASLLRNIVEIDKPAVRRRLRRGLVRRGELPTDAIGSLLATDDAGVRIDAAWLAGASAHASLKDAANKAAERSEKDWRTLDAKTTAPGDTQAEHKLGELQEAWRASLWALRRIGGGADRARAAVEGKAPAPVRSEALRVLAAAGSSEDVARVQARLSDPDPSVRTAAAQALLALDAAKALAVVSAKGVADLRIVSTLANEALGRDAKGLLSSADARPNVLPAALAGKQVEPLAALAKEADDATRLAAIDALGRVAGAEPLAALEALHGDDKQPENIRKAAWRALRRAQRKNDRAAALAQLQEAR